MSDRLEVGGVELELTHARGETDDATWIWWPARRILFSGDLFFWVAPNAGNPQKVQRYAAEWATALRAMAARGAEILVPGHGAPIFGADRVRDARGLQGDPLHLLCHLEGPLQGRRVGQLDVHEQIPLVLAGDEP